MFAPPWSISRSIKARENSLFLLFSFSPDNFPAKSNLRTLQDALQAVHKMSQNEKLSSEKASLKDSKSVSATTVLSKSLTVQSVKPGKLRVCKDYIHSYFDTSFDKKRRGQF